MNYELLFDLVKTIGAANRDHHAPTERTFRIGEKDVKLDIPGMGAVLNKSLQAFMHGVGAPGMRAESKIQAFSGSSDLPKLTMDVFNNVMAVPNSDLAWQESFRGVQLQKGQLSWEIATTSTGMVFKEIPEGQKIEYKGVSGEKVTADIKKYGAALGITWETIEGRKLYRFIEQLDDARAKLYVLWANVHYGLLNTAGSGNTVAWQGAVTLATIDRDIKTLNKGAYDLANACKDKGYGDTANAEFLLYCSPLLRNRINAALRATNAQILQGSKEGQTVDFNIKPLYTFNSAITANHALLVLPGRRIQNSVYMHEMGLSRQEIESLTELRTYWTAFGAAVADTDQVYDLAFA